MLFNFFFFFLTAFSLSPVPGPEHDIGGLQGTGASSVLRTSRAQRAAGRQMHQNVSAEAFPTTAGPLPPRLARDRIQLGRTGGRPRGSADEQHHKEDNRYAMNGQGAITKWSLARPLVRCIIIFFFINPTYIVALVFLTRRCSGSVKCQTRS